MRELDGEWVDWEEVEIFAFLGRLFCLPDKNRQLNRGKENFVLDSSSDGRGNGAGVATPNGAKRRSSGSVGLKVFMASKMVSHSPQRNRPCAAVSSFIVTRKIALQWLHCVYMTPRHLCDHFILVVIL
ncbi:hypothetical protein VSS37_18305 [Candidatus Thiothrix sp. Deng01]|uniref:Uncharacterized protein n=1 Tax=Candidatus Thiothrix phosphatis TaxID=3112415 RepID=A0ABU6D3Q1_9GAMM|nr:hypothetical protein [Candidatus Thiothrix sp. Deng01]MEB4592938.1 hypothetical protein [Candidatus Thiothrix sp. Deng01]